MKPGNGYLEVQKTHDWFSLSVLGRSWWEVASSAGTFESRPGP